MGETEIVARAVPAQVRPCIRPAAADLSGFGRYRPLSGFVAHLLAQHEGAALLGTRRRGTPAEANRAYAATAGRLLRRVPPGYGRALVA